MAVGEHSSEHDDYGKGVLQGGDSERLRNSKTRLILVQRRIKNFNLKFLNLFGDQAGSNRVN